MPDTRLFQARMARFQDKIRRKLVDNMTSLTGQATDCIRVRVKRTKQLDIESRVVEDVNVIPIVFPPLVDVPYRRLNQVDGQYRLESFVAATDLFPIQIQTTQIDKIYVGDLIFRILRDSQVTQPIVMVLEVIEAKGTFGAQSLIWGKFDCVYYNDTLPQEMLDMIVEVAERRQYLDF